VNLLLKERDFRLIVVAVGLSSFGDVLAAVALTIRVHDLTGSGRANGRRAAPARSSR